MLAKHYGVVEHGNLKMDNQQDFDTSVSLLDGEVVEVTVRKKKKMRTIKQNAYYWGVVIKLISDDTGHTPDEIHEFCKQRFLKSLIRLKDEIYSTVESTTDLESNGFSNDYIEKIKQWAYEDLNITIPEAEQL